MKSISSAEFRKTYPRLTEDVVVTANGHNIGFWKPAGYRIIVSDAEGVVTLDEERKVSNGAVQHAALHARPEEALTRANQGVLRRLRGDRPDHSTSARYH